MRDIFLPKDMHNTFYLTSNPQTPEDEKAALAKLKDAGISVTPGMTYRGAYGEFGWGRMLFAVKREVMIEALARMKKVLRPDLADQI